MIEQQGSIELRVLGLTYLLVSVVTVYGWRQITSYGNFGFTHRIAAVKFKVQLQ